MKTIFIVIISVLGHLPFILSGQEQQRHMADSLKRAGAYKPSLELYSSLLKANEKTGNAELLSRDHNDIANVYCMMGDYVKSTEHYFEALRWAEKWGNKKWLGTVYYDIAQNFLVRQRDSAALPYLIKAIELLKSEREGVELGNSYNALATVYEKTDYKKAKENFDLAVGIYTRIKDKNALGNAYTNMSYMELGHGNYNACIEYARKAMGFFKETNDKPGIAVSYINIQTAHYFNNKDPREPETVHPGKWINSEYKKQLQYGVQLLDSALLAIKDVVSPEHYITIYGNKSELYKFMGNNDSAYKYLSAQKTLSDSLNDISRQQRIEEISIKYENEKKEQNILLLEKENEERKLWIVITVISGLLAVAVLLLIVLRINSIKKQKQIEFEKSKLEFEGKALRAQMNPHFLFNAINSIQSYILNEDQQAAYDYLAKFSKLMRIVLNNSQEKNLSLRSELEMIKLYVEMEQLRFNESFDFNLSVAKDVNEQDIVVPAMLIQPYVENAIWHGLMNLENERRGVLNLRITIQDTLLKIVVEDNGVGRERAKEYKKDEAHQSVGMKLTEQRLMLMGKMEEYENAKVIVGDVKNEKGDVCGTRVEIFIPVNAQ